jgi:hypothetical protein
MVDDGFWWLLMVDDGFWWLLMVDYDDDDDGRDGMKISTLYESNSFVAFTPLYASNLVKCPILQGCLNPWLYVSET